MFVLALSTTFSYRQAPTFGRDTIRRFRHNVSELKQMAARDFEDLLQVNLLVFHLLALAHRMYIDLTSGQFQYS